MTGHLGIARFSVVTLLSSYQEIDMVGFFMLFIGYLEIAQYMIGPAIGRLPTN